MSTRVSDLQSERVYGSARLQGMEHKDIVCVRFDVCVNDFEYFAIYNQTGIKEPIDGILGLARNRWFYQSKSIKKDARGVGPLYFDALTTKGHIEEQKFSFYFSGQRGVAYIDFGTPQVDAMSSADDIRWINVLDDFFWSAYNQGIGVGSTDPEDTYAYSPIKKHPDFVVNNAMYTIIDTGSSALIVSNYYFEDLIRLIFDKVGDDEYKFQGGYVYTRCYDNFPPLYFMFDDYWIEVLPEEYVWDSSRA